MISGAEHLFMCPLSTLCNKARKKSYRLKKEEIQLSLFTDDMDVPLENSQLHKKLELISVFCKVSDYNVNIQKSNVFLYNSNEKLEPQKILNNM